MISVSVLQAQSTAEDENEFNYNELCTYQFQITLLCIIKVYVGKQMKHFIS